MSIYRDPREICDYLEGWLKERLAEANAKGVALGVSGGIDSAVVAGLASRVCGGENVLGVIMPAHSLPIDEEYARLLGPAFGIRVVKVDLSATYDTLLSEIVKTGIEPSPLATANIKPRLRMTALYAFAHHLGYLVCGGGNKDEITYGYFTKYGDAGVDLFPLADLLKGEVWRLAEYIGVPRPIIDRPPTAGLWDGQTDETEMGITYADLDRYLATGEAQPEVRANIEKAIARSAHKRRPAPMAILPESIR